MKKISILSVLAVFVSFSCLHAQIINKGDVVLGGTFAFSNSNQSSDYSSSNTSINPRIGYALGNNSVLYARFGAAFGKTNYSASQGNITNNSFTAGLSWKKFFPVKEKLGWYTDVFATMGAASSKQTLTTSLPPTVYKVKSTDYVVGINPGIYFMATPRIIVSADFGGFGYSYQSSKSSGQPTSHASNFNINLLNYFGFGVDFIIGGKKS